MRWHVYTSSWGVEAGAAAARWHGHLFIVLWSASSQNKMYQVGCKTLCNVVIASHVIVYTA